MVGGERLFVEDVERRNDLAGLNRGDESRFVDERTSRSVDQNGALFHAGDVFRPDEAAAARLQNHVHGNDIGAAHEIRFADEKGASLMSLLCVQVWTPGHDPHIERKRIAGEARPEAA